MVRTEAHQMLSKRSKHEPGSHTLIVIYRKFYALVF